MRPRVQFLLRDLAPSVNEMPHFSWLEFKLMQTLLNGTVGLGQSRVLEQVFGHDSTINVSR